MHVVLVTICLGLVFGWYLLQTRVSFIDEWVNANEYLVGVPGYKIKELIFRPELFSLETVKHYAKFFIVLYWSFWGVFGYMTIHLHHFWYMMLAFGQFLAILGLLRFRVRVKMHRVRLEEWKAKTLYMFFVSIFLVIVIPFFRSVVFRPGQEALTQGRYLFPVLIPISIFTVLGLSSIIPFKYHRLVGSVCFGGLLLLDSVCLSNYILLNFHGISIF